MFENIIKFFKKTNKKEALNTSSREMAKERLHLVLMQDRANVSADFLDLMRQEIIEVIKKYIDIDERAMDVRLTNQENEDGTQGAPALYANIPIVNIKENARNVKKEIEKEKKEKEEDRAEEKITDKSLNKNSDENNEVVNEETKEVEEKVKKIVKEKKSSHNIDNEDKKIEENSKDADKKTENENIVTEDKK